MINNSELPQEALEVLTTLKGAVIFPRFRAIKVIQS